MPALLRLEAIEVGYGDVTAVCEVSLEVRQGETVALIGSNGAGKTTTLRAISGLFPSMTVLENLELGCRSAPSRARKKETLGRVFELFPRLGERRQQIAGTLSGGEQQMCAIGRGLMACPRLLMLDEPSLGLAPVMVKSIFENLRRINARGTTILLVEQNVLRSLQLAHRAYVLENGRIALDGPAADLLASRHIKQAYLGL